MIKFPSASSMSNYAAAARVNRATYYMIMYPIIYTICTAPLAIGRMYAMSGGKKTPLWFYAFAGCLIISCGWIDSLVYTITRRVFNHSDDSHNGGTSRSNHRFSSLNNERFSTAVLPEQRGTGQKPSPLKDIIGSHTPEHSAASVPNSITKTTTITKTTSIREKESSRKARPAVFTSSPDESDNESLIRDGISVNTAGSGKSSGKV